MGHPLVSVFIDGLRPDWVEQMPFVRSLGTAQDLATEFGYSIACHATMYTGASIQEHGLWFVWQRDPARSRFPAGLARTPRVLDNIGSRLLLRKALLSRMHAGEVPRGYFGVPRLVHVPIRQWPGLWVSEDRFWDEDGFAPVPTVFEHARRAGLSFRSVGLHRGGGHLASVERPLDLHEPARDWYYLFIGEVDHAAHVSGGHGTHFTEVLHAADAAIAARCAEVERRYGGFDLVLFSDHGHQEATKPVDIYERLQPELLQQVPHVVDTNFARFWTRDEDEAKRVRAALSERLPEGWVLEESELRRWECWFDDQRYGDVIFYLDSPAVFTRTAWGYSRSQKSVHGYIPSNPAMAGTFVTTLPGVTAPRLRDVFGVHMQRLSLTVP